MLADPRYMNADDFVHYIEFVNSIIAIALVLVVMYFMSGDIEN